MPPRKKIAKEEIVAAGLELVRTQGAGALNARSIAAYLGCSTQPIFSNFAAMGDLRLAVAAAAEELEKVYIQQEIERGLYPPYKASGMAYIRFAGEERELFKLLYMRDRSQEPPPEGSELNDRMEDLVHGNTGLEADAVKLFHMEMWAYVHGIAAMSATGYLDLDTALISRMLTDAYEGLKLRFGKGG